MEFHKKTFQVGRAREKTSMTIWYAVGYRIYVTGGQFGLHRVVPLPGMEASSGAVTTELLGWHNTLDEAMTNAQLDEDHR